jgi:hypothetical protein
VHVLSNEGYGFFCPLFYNKRKEGKRRIENP